MHRALVLCCLLVTGASLISSYPAMGQEEPPPGAEMEIPDIDQGRPTPLPEGDPVEIAEATDQFLEEAMFMDQAAGICDEYHQNPPEIQPEGIDKAILRFYSRVMVDKTGEDVDLAADPQAVASMRSVIATGLDCESEAIFFDLGKYYAPEEDAAEGISDDDFIQSLRDQYAPDLDAETPPAEGEEAEGDDVDAPPMLATPEDPLGPDNCCIPLHLVEPNGGHPWVVECPPTGFPPAAAPSGNVIPDVRRYGDGSSPSAAELVGLAYACQAGRVFRAQRAVDFWQTQQQLDTGVYMLKPILFGGLYGGAFLVTAPATASGVAVAGVIAVTTTLMGTEGLSATLYGNTAVSLLEGGNPLSPSSFAIPLAEKAYDAVTGNVRERALEMIGRDAELAELSAGDLLNQRRKFKEVEARFKRLGGVRPGLTDTACNNMDAWFWR